jgi:hypothetical protein
VTRRLRLTAGAMLLVEQSPFVAAAPQAAPQPLTLSFARLPAVAQAAARTVVLPALAVQALVRARPL